MKTVKKYDEFLGKKIENVSEKKSESKLVVDDDIYAYIKSYHVTVFSEPRDYDIDSILIQVDLESDEINDNIDVFVVEKGDYSDEDVERAIELVKKTFKNNLIATGVALNLKNPNEGDLNTH